MRRGSPASATPRQRRSTSCTSGRFIENTWRTARRRTSGWSSSVTAGSSRSSRSLTIAWHTSIRKPAIPRANQKRRMSSNASAHVLVPPVEVGLRREEVRQEVLARRLVQLPRRAAEVRLPVVRRAAAGRRVRPHVVVAVPGVAARAGVLEPRVAVARVVGDEVEQDADPALAGRGDQRVEVLERAEVRVHGRVIADVVAPVVVRRRHRRIQPDPVDPEPLQVVEPVGDAPQVADPVAVGVREGARVDLVEDAVAPPRLVGHGGAGYEGAVCINTGRAERPRDAPGRARRLRAHPGGGSGATPRSACGSSAGSPSCATRSPPSTATTRASRRSGSALLRRGRRDRRGARARPARARPRARDHAGLAAPRAGRRLRRRTPTASPGRSPASASGCPTCASWA